jgi:hypothetical protein
LATKAIGTEIGWKEGNNAPNIWLKFGRDISNRSEDMTI